MMNIRYRGSKIVCNVKLIHRLIFLICGLHFHLQFKLNIWIYGELPQLQSDLQLLQLKSWIFLGQLMQRLDLLQLRLLLQISSKQHLLQLVMLRIKLLFLTYAEHFKQPTQLNSLILLGLPKWQPFKLLILKLVLIFLRNFTHSQQKNN